MSTYRTMGYLFKDVQKYIKNYFCLKNNVFNFDKKKCHQCFFTILIFFLNTKYVKTRKTSIYRSYAPRATRNKNDRLKNEAPNPPPVFGLCALNVTLTQGEWVPIGIYPLQI